MKIYESENQEDIAEALTRTIEEETGNKIFTIRVLDTPKEGVEVLVVFDDKSILNGLISVQPMNGKLACRIQGNYI